jgi:hypothetical protein
MLELHENLPYELGEDDFLRERIGLDADHFAVAVFDSEQLSELNVSVQNRAHVLG